MIFSATEGLDIGRESGTAVLPDSAIEHTVFTGEIKWVELNVGQDDDSHMLDPKTTCTCSCRTSDKDLPRSLQSGQSARAVPSRDGGPVVTDPWSSERLLRRRSR
jgi:hypothetical protein